MESATFTTATYAHGYTKRFLESAKARVTMHRRFLTAELDDYVTSKLARLSDALNAWVDSSDRSIVKLKLIVNLARLLKKRLMAMFTLIAHATMCMMCHEDWCKIALSDILTPHNLPR